MVLDDAAPTNSRKRKASESIANDKPRGRPKKDIKDESAAERRRTQIRLAQRAYRARKETTIDELRQRVADLTDVVDRIGRRADDFSARISYADMPDHARREVSTLINDLDLLVRNARDGDSPATPPTNNVVKNISAISVQPHVQATADAGMSGYSSDSGATTERASDIKRRLADPTMSPLEALAFASAGHNLEADVPLGAVTQAERELLVGSDSSSVSSISRIAQPFLDTPAYESWQVPHMLDIEPVSTYAHFEKSFARRLQRICTEVAYHCLSDPARAPGTHERVFRLHLRTLRDLNVLRKRYTMALSRGINDNLDSAYSPYCHIGGAGLHYEDTSGCRRPDVVTEDSVALDLIANSIPGLEGEWLDTNDVQGYLHDLGIKVDGAASYVHTALPLEVLATPADLVEIDSCFLSASRHHGLEDIELFNNKFMRRRTPDGRDEPYDPFACDPAVPGSGTSSFSLLPIDQIDLRGLADVMEAPMRNDLHAFALTGTQFYTSGENGTLASMVNPARRHARGHGPSSETSESSTEKGRPGMLRGGLGGAKKSAFVTPDQSGLWHAEERMNVTIDVQKMIKLLMMGGVCLGRAPGFRRRGVDAAIRGAVVRSY